MIKLLRDFVEIIGIASGSDFPVITPTTRYNQFTVEESVTIPAEKPDIEQINSVMIEATINNFHSIATPVGLKVIVNGTLNQKVIYTAADPSQSVHSAHFEVPFCTFIQIPLVIPAGQSATTLLQTLNITLEDVVASGPNVIIEDLSVAQIDARRLKKCAVLFSWVEINTLLLPLVA
ncbi:MAG: DUF3794 domain-containing protein [Desulfitobacteriaceae bacterium]